jgi:HAD superfamily hydrolase (TIGR01509 family)
LKGIIFDLDGVLVDSMPFHYRAWKKAFKEIASVHVDEKLIYSLEGMSGKQLIKKVFQLKEFTDNSKIEQINSKKKELFLGDLNFKCFPSVKTMINNLRCTKGLVTGSTKKETDMILKKILTNSKFEHIITGDNVKKCKPDPQAFNLFLSKTGLKPEEVIVVENSPLGVQAARNSKMRCILTLNNSPLDSSEFKNFIDEENIFENTHSVYNYLRSWCNNENSKKISHIKAKISS